MKAAFEILRDMGKKLSGGLSAVSGAVAGQGYFGARCYNTKAGVMHQAKAPVPVLHNPIASAKQDSKSWTGMTDLMSAAAVGNLAQVQALIAKGVDINAQGCYGSTALCLAARRGHLKVVQALLDNGADKELTGVWGDTPLISAAIHRHFDVMNFLVSRGANIWRVNINNKDAMFYTTDVDMRNFLKEAGSAIMCVEKKSSAIMLVPENPPLGGNAWAERLRISNRQPKSSMREMLF